MPGIFSIHPERLDAGIVHVVGSMPEDKTGGVQVELVYCGRVLTTVPAFPDDRSRFRAEIPLPPEAISDGVQTYTLRLQQTPDVLTHITVIAGAVLKTDLYAELDQLRAELEILKSAFRRHCAEAGKPS